ncbi:MAG TPA: helix-turn-helix transcriptional regulator [Solirubrobacterales bacterium]|nr:helix-turn-helix transcriptional regulator [Solirubrobacterales bacterium]
MPEDGVTFAARLGENVRILRRHRNLTQATLAARSGLHRDGIGMVERGLRTPRADTAFRLAGALGVPIEKLFITIVWVPAPSAGELFFSTRLAWHREVLRRAAALRARQIDEVDVVALIRESRDELERRGCPDEEDDAPPS